MKFVHKTHRGKIREINEDYYYVPSQDGNLFVVADGMGGHLAGETASKLCVETLVEEFEKTEIKDEGQLYELFEKIINNANEIVYNKSTQDSNLRGMGTTLSLGYIFGNKFYYSNIGDSRIYLIDTTIEQLTKDDSFVNYLVELGEITEDEARVHPKKNVITKAIGTTEKIDSQVMNFEIKNQKVLICTDGLTNMVTDEEIFDVIKNNEFEKTADILVDKALDAGGLDNITLIIIDLE